MRVSAGTLMWAAMVVGSLVPASWVHASCANTAGTGHKYKAEIVSNKPMVQVRINGSRPLRFVLDTGSAFGGSIDDSLITSLGFHTASAITGGGGAGEHQYEVKTLAPKACEQMAGASLADAGLRGLDLSQISSVEGVRIDGLIGSDFIKRYVIEIDYRHSTVRVLNGSYEYHGAGLVVPITTGSGFAITTASIRKPTGGTVSGNFIIDTGVRTALNINAPFAAQNGLLDGQENAPRMTIGIGIGGESRGALVRIPELQLGSLHLRDVVASISLDKAGIFASPRFAGIIGADLLRRYKVFLDYPHQRIILEPTPDSQQPFGFDESGLFLLAVGPQLRFIQVFRVLPGSPGDEAGIREGDMIVSIDGRPTAKLGLDSVRKQFQLDGNEYSIQLLRGGQRIDVSLRTRNLLATTKS